MCAQKDTVILFLIYKMWTIIWPEREKQNSKPILLKYLNYFEKETLTQNFYFIKPYKIYKIK